MLKEALEFKETMAKNFILDDWQAVEILLAVVLSHKVVHTEMLWLRLIGASGTGKTEILRAIEKVEYAAVAEYFSPAALRGGYMAKGRNRKELGPMLLERINGKLVITKEFAAILTARKEDRNQVLGILRGVYDGSLDSDFGGEQRHLHQTTRFDWIIGTTPYVDQQRQLETQLGSRFIDLRWRTPENGKELAQKAMANDPDLDGIRDRLSSLMRAMVDVAPSRERSELDYIADLAVFTSKYRTPVKRDTRTREIMEMPDIESPARVSQGLARIAAGLATLQVDNIKPYLSRLALDTLTKTRAAYVRALKAGVRGRDELSQACGISVGAMTYVREEMRMLGFDEDSDLEFLDGG